MASNKKNRSPNNDTLLDADDSHSFTTPKTDSTFHVSTTVSSDKALISDELKGEWQQELAKTEDEIQTLRSVLNAKLRHAEELKMKLGISPIQEFKEDFNQGIKNLKETAAYKKSAEVVHDIQGTLSENPIFQKTSETVKKAGETLNETLNPIICSVSSSVKNKFCDIKNSKVYKSFEDTMGDAYCSVKGKITGQMATSPIVTSEISEEPNTPILKSETK